MGRTVAAIPNTWKTSGVWYCPKISDPCDACEGTGGGAAGPCAECKGSGVIQNRDRADPFMVRVAPFSGDEFNESLAGLRSKALMVDAVEGKAEVFADPIKIANEQAQDVCRKRVMEVYGYAGREVGTEGEPTGTVVEPKNGAELVDFILKNAWQEERRVLDDIYDAIRKRSHLSTGLKKNWSRPLASSQAATNPSTGDAPSVSVTDMSTPTTSQSSSSGP